MAEVKSWWLRRRKHPAHGSALWQKRSCPRARTPAAEVVAACLNSTGHTPTPHTHHRWFHVGGRRIRIFPGRGARYGMDFGTANRVRASKASGVYSVVIPTRHPLACAGRALTPPATPPAPPPPSRSSLVPLEGDTELAAAVATGAASQVTASIAAGFSSASPDCASPDKTGRMPLYYYRIWHMAALLQWESPSFFSLSLPPPLSSFPSVMLPKD